MMRIIGIDPGIERVGYAVVDNLSGKERLIESGCIITSSKLQKAARFLQISQELKKIISQTKPQKAAIETVFFAKNVKTAITVAEARGVILVLLKELSIDIKEFTPLEVKIALTGYGRAEKKQVEFMVGKILDLKQKLRPDDVADAAALAIAAIAEKSY